MKMTNLHCPNAEIGNYPVPALKQHKDWGCQPPVREAGL
jgi:hypothetical protein